MLLLKDWKEHQWNIFRFGILTRGDYYRPQAVIDTLQVPLAVLMADAQAYQTLRSLVKEIRIEAGLRQQDLADRLGAGQSFVSKYESGERRLDVLELRGICAACGVSMADFVERLEERLKGPVAT